MWDGGRAVTGLWADFDSICTRFGNCANFDNADNWDSKIVIFLTITEIISYQLCGLRIELDAIKPMFFVVTCSNRRSKKLFFHSRTIMVVAGVMYVCMNDCV